MSAKGSGSHATHARFSASGADRWVTCTASVLAIEKAIERGDLSSKGKTSAAAAEGTIAHDYAEAYLAFLIHDKDKPEVPDAIADDVQILHDTYIKECHDLSLDGGMVLLEHQIPLFYSKEETGTCDFIHIADDGTISVRDLKYGAGNYTQLLKSRNNRQLAIYSLSAIEWLIENEHLFDFEISDKTQLNLSLVKPRVNDDGNETWEITLEELRDFCESITIAADSIRSGKVRFRPTKKACQWCELGRANKCPARQIQATGFFPEEFDTRLLTDEEKIALVKNESTITSFIKDIKTELLERSLDGETIDGIHLTTGRQGNRTWIDMKEAQEFLDSLGFAEDQIYTKKLITLPQAEKLVGKEHKEKIADLTFRSAGKTTIAFDDDERPKFTPIQDGLFDFN